MFDEAVGPDPEENRAETNALPGLRGVFLKWCGPQEVTAAGEGMEGGFPDAPGDLIAVGVVLGGDATDEHGQGTGEDAGWQYPQWKRRIQED